MQLLGKIIGYHCKSGKQQRYTLIVGEKKVVGKKNRYLHEVKVRIAFFFPRKTWLESKIV